jgi:hypothetical protein
MNNQRIHEGILLLDQNKRYYICEPEEPACQMVTLMSGCAAEVMLDSQWMSGHIEGDGQGYWFFLETGSKFKLVEGMVARYAEPCCAMLDGGRSISLLAEEDAYA